MPPPARALAVLKRAGSRAKNGCEEQQPIPATGPRGLDSEPLAEAERHALEAGLIDGPFAEIRELVAGYWLWEVKGHG